MGYGYNRVGQGEHCLAFFDEGPASLPCSYNLSNFCAKSSKYTPSGKSHRVGLAGFRQVPLWTTRYSVPVVSANPKVRVYPAGGLGSNFSPDCHFPATPWVRRPPDACHVGLPERAAWFQQLRAAPGLPQRPHFGSSLGALIRRLAADKPPTRMPSRQECRFRDISAADCPERVDEPTLHQGETLDF